jgi:very-short-patch-repair endonuclease
MKMRGPNVRRVKVERHLRRDATQAETALWFALRDRRLSGFKFVRQEGVGRYVVDFVCRERKLVIEIDGSQHADSATDGERDTFLRGEGYRVLRFWNNDVLTNRPGVLTAINAALEGEDVV